MKKSFALRVDVEVYEAIEKWAADEFRSTNGQIEWILSDALKRAKRQRRRPAGGDPAAPSDGQPSENPAKEHRLREQ